VRPQTPVLRIVLFGLALGAASTGLAAAAQQLVMPFDCRADGGKVLLAPSAPQAYTVYGFHEERRLTTCSPFYPHRCQHWFVHRFDIDCGGVRTSWQSVVAAMTPILIRRPRPEAQEGPYAGGPYGGPAIARAPRQAPPWVIAPRQPGRLYSAGPGPVIDIPQGFAPNPMQIARFVAAPPVPLQAAMPPNTTAPIASSEVPRAEPAPPPAAAAPAPASAASAPSKASADEQKVTSLAKSDRLQGSSETTGSLPKPDSGSLWRDAAMVFTLTLAALLALSTTLLYWRRRKEDEALHALYEPAALPRPAGPSNPVLGPVPVDRPQDGPPSPPRLHDPDWLPSTKSEALKVLGVSPEAGRDLIKLTVTQLRRAWHPDHAFDEDDRRLRERRLKQINVAWDIISGKRRSLWLGLKPRSS
jgi:hypothetical protein